MQISSETTKAALPFVHVTSWSSALSILDNGYLKPYYSDVFKEETLYLSYGKVVYEPSLKPYSWIDDLPVVFVFSPRLINSEFDFYPFDTGAFVAGHLERFENSIEKYLKLYKKRNDFRTTPLNWVVDFFGNNDNYLSKSKISLPEKTCITNEAREFLVDSYSNRTDIDQRFVSIECLFKDSIRLRGNLACLWIHGDYKKVFEIKNRNFDISKNKIRYYLDYSNDGSIPPGLRSSVEGHIGSYNY